MDYMTIGSAQTGKGGEVGMRLIDADALADALFEKRKNYPQWVADVIGKMPEAIVRCCNCKHHRKGTCSAGAGMSYPPPDDWFCADGERKDES